ncbi:GDSL esterase/lipase At1g71250 [Amborella trichopoda]|nr:GDSL esterase/lipase At1g71250 [Amborella trichopoda]|eukprot:XP_020519608.1 GDSL esterase/lipase At1g71250 [Amborella trichopoda]
MGVVSVVLLVGVGSGSSTGAVFVFGDDLLDSGNNNYIPSMAKSNFPPYGLDFPQGPTGRFSNGKTPPTDLLRTAEFVGLPYPPPYTDPATVGPKILQGLNYASAAAGILDQTGQHYIARIPMNKQIENFRESIGNMLAIVNQNTTTLSAHLAKSVFIIAIGSNDYMNNYLLPELYSSSAQFTPLAFSDMLVRQLAQQLMVGILALFYMGARKLVVSSVGPLGCTPSQVHSSGGAQCVERVNEMVVLFNSALRTLLINLNSRLPSANFVFVDVFGIMSDILINPYLYGFSVTLKSCCEVGEGKGQISCVPSSIPCANRNSYAFWDGFHPTEALYRVVAERSFFGPQSDAYPMNIQQLTLQ